MVLADLITYHYWANDRLLKLMDPLTDEQFTHAFGSSFSSIRDTVAHMLNAEAVWLERVTGQPQARVAPADVPSAAAARERWHALRAGLTAWAAGLAAGGAKERSILAKTSAGPEYWHSAQEIALHLVVHGSYHRGQVVTMLRQSGLPAVSLDLITYYRE